MYCCCDISHSHAVLVHRAGMMPQLLWVAHLLLQDAVTAWAMRRSTAQASAVSDSLSLLALAVDTTFVMSQRWSQHGLVCLFLRCHIRL